MAKKSVSYTKTTKTTVKAVGFIDLEKGVIETEDGNVSFKDLLKDLLKDVDGENGEFQFSTKINEELDLGLPSNEE